MDSVPGRNAGLGSAINNALSRVGQPLIGALIFVAISAWFYPSLASRVPGLDPSDPAVRAAIVPLNPLRSDAPVDLAESARIASVEAFHLAALVSAALLVAGSGVLAVGLRDRRGGAGRWGDGRHAGSARPDRTGGEGGRRGGAPSVDEHASPTDPSP